MVAIKLSEYAVIFSSSSSPCNAKKPETWGPWNHRTSSLRRALPWWKRSWCLWRSADRRRSRSANSVSRGSGLCLRPLPAIGTSLGRTGPLPAMDASLGSTGPGRVASPIHAQQTLAHAATSRRRRRAAGHASAAQAAARTPQSPNGYGSAICVHDKFVPGFFPRSSMWEEHPGHIHR